MVYRQLGEMLIVGGYISEEQLNKALDAQKKSKSGEKLGEVLVRMGYITQRQMNDGLGKQLGCPFIDLTSNPPGKELSRVLPRTIAKKHNIVPVRSTADTVYIAMADPLNFVAIDEARLATKKKVEPMLATENFIIPGSESCTTLCPRPLRAISSKCTCNSSTASKKKD